MHQAKNKPWQVLGKRQTAGSIKSIRPSFVWHMEYANLVAESKQNPNSQRHQMKASG